MTDKEKKTVTLSQDQFNTIMERLNKVEGKEASPEAVAQAFPTGVPSGSQLGPQGQVIGVVERYPVDQKHYQDPTDALYDAPELAQFALRHNYVIRWNVTPTKYQTAMGTWYIEPRFELILLRKQFDDEGNEIEKVNDQGQTYKPRIILGRASFFEDPPANLIEADQAGVVPGDLDAGVFNEKMRMYRYKFWLTEKLRPRGPKKTNTDTKLQVIAGKAYEIEEFSTPV